MVTKSFSILLLFLPLSVFGVPSENLKNVLHQGRNSRPRGCSDVCRPGKGTAFQECGNSRRPNPDCELQVCQQTNLGGQIHAGYKCTPRFIEPSFPPFPRFTPEPRETFAPVPTLDCPEVCRESQFLAEDDCSLDGFPVAGCRSDSVCSTTSGSGFQCVPFEGVTETTVFLQSIDGLELLLEYQWGPGQFDLDSSTEFLGSSVGTACGNSGTFIEFLGDNVSEGGVELYVVRISDALDAGAWSGSTTVGLFGGWFGDVPPGTITISASLRDASSSIPIANSEVFIVVTPNGESGCLDNQLGEITITQLSDSVSLEIVAQ